MAVLATTQQAVMLSGIAGESFITKPTPETRELSGGATAFVAAPIILKAIIPSPISGGEVSYSGSVIYVFDAVSGMLVLDSGKALYNYSFGTHSGLGWFNIANPPPIVTDMDLVVKSGLNIQGAAGLKITYGYVVPL